MVEIGIARNFTFVFKLLLSVKQKSFLSESAFRITAFLSLF